MAYSLHASEGMANPAQGIFYRNAFRDGEFIRPDTQFRKQISSSPDAEFPPDAGRYHLYVSLACPWSHRVVLTRSLRKLENVISMSVTNPIWNENGWFFGNEPGAVADFINYKRDVIDLYRLADPHFDDDETVPILWDKRTKTIVNNESREIMRMLNVEFLGLGDPKVTLYPSGLEQEINTALDQMYGPINDGVYRAGFAQSQRAYERAVRALFDKLDEFETRLSMSRYVCGDIPTEADIALFVTLYRFDAVYYSHFKCNRKRITDYPNLWGWLRDVYQTNGVAVTCDMNHIKKHYYGSHKNLNPSGIIPIGPDINFETPPHRLELGIDNSTYSVANYP